MPFTVEVNKYSSKPISNKRVMPPAALLVCKVDNTKCPVKADCTAIRAVSKSRISPIMMTSGSCLTIDRKAAANVKPICGFA